MNARPTPRSPICLPVTPAALHCAQLFQNALKTILKSPVSNLAAQDHRQFYC